MSTAFTPEGTASTIPELFYDLLSILMPGLYFLISLHFIHPDAVGRLRTDVVIHPAVTVIILAYLLGYFLYSISSIIVVKPFERLLGQPAHFLLLSDPSGKFLQRHRQLFIGVPDHSSYLRGSVERTLRHLLGNSSFRIDETNISLVYEYARNFVMEKSARRAVSIRKEQAYGEMSRALVVISLALLGLAPIFYLTEGRLEAGLAIQTAIHFAFLVTFSFRYAQARLINPYLVYVTFSIMIPGRLEPTGASTTENQQ